MRTEEDCGRITLLDRRLLTRRLWSSHSRFSTALPLDLPQTGKHRATFILTVSLVRALWRLGNFEMGRRPCPEIFSLDRTFLILYTAATFGLSLRRHQKVSGIKKPPESCSRGFSSLSSPLGERYLDP